MTVIKPQATAYFYFFFGLALAFGLDLAFLSDLQPHLLHIFRPF